MNLLCHELITFNSCLKDRELINFFKSILTPLPLRGASLQESPLNRAFTGTSIQKLLPYRKTF